MSTYVELRTKTAFSFLRGASHPDALVRRASSLGYTRLGISDRDGLHGVVRAHRAGREHGVEILVGAEILLPGLDGRPPSYPSPGLLLYATDRTSYAGLSRLLSVSKLRTGKGGFDLCFDDIVRHHTGLIAIHCGHPDPFLLARELELFGDRLYLSVDRHMAPEDEARVELAREASLRSGVPLVVTGDVRMHDRDRKPLLDILTCIRLGIRLEGAGRRLPPNAFAHLKSPKEMALIHRDLPQALARTVEVADRCRFRLDELRHEFALESLPEGETPMGYLRQLVERGADERYPRGVPGDVRAQIEHELRLIEQLDFAGYFLTVWDIVRFARSQKILCQGRGSAANSVVCYVLGITAIDPVRMDLLFERFISVERGEPPDIDVDFEHERREEVMQYVYEKYGREHSGLVATFITYRPRSAFRDVAKVFGFSEDQLERLSGLASSLAARKDDEAAAKAEGDARNWVWGERRSASDDDLRRAGLDPRDPTVQQVIHWANELRGLPRHLGQHSGGFLITKQPIFELTTIENASMPFRTVIAWDKDDIEALGFFKIDLLSLGMLTAVRRSFDLVAEYEGRTLELATIPGEDTLVYDMISDADTVGTFQVESRAQMQTLPKLKPRTFYDLVVSVAIIRPGPIQGDMVHPYLRRRAGEEPVEYPHPALEDILGRTYGVPLFQEQAMKIAIKVAGFSGGEADHLRRAIGWNSKEHIDRLHDRLVSGMLERGVSKDYAERVFRMLQGFGGYGFPESHAASFALIGYVSCYLKRYHPAAFACALLNSQPMGFYSPNTLIQDAQRHGVFVRKVSVLESDWHSRLESGDERAHKKWWAESGRSLHARHTPWADRMLGRRSRGLYVQPEVRLGLREVKGLSEGEARRIVEARAARPFSNVADLVHRAELSRGAAERLAKSGALTELDHPERRRSLWKVSALGGAKTLFSGLELQEESSPPIRPMTEEEILAADYESLGLSVDRHPMKMLRADMKAQGILGSKDLLNAAHDARLRVGGMVITRQRPGTASGVMFITLEDEDGHMNLVVFPSVIERQRELINEAHLIVAEGRLQRDRSGVLNVIVDGLAPLRRSLAQPGKRHDRFGGHH